MQIPTYIINLKFRTDRRAHILNEFSEHGEFIINLIEPLEHSIGAISLWSTIQHIISIAEIKGLEFVLICEDDHQFTESYSTDALIEGLNQAKKKNADILLGGVSWFQDALQISEQMFWVRRFTGMQFAVVFKKFYQTVLNAPFEINDAADFKISSLTTNKFFIHPFVSVQREFGYSDATEVNNVVGRVDKLFAKSLASVDTLKRVGAFYKDRLIEAATINYDNVFIPTYIINLPHRADRVGHIKKQFEGRTEFEITIIEACHHKIGALGLWWSILKIIKIATLNEDDVILICADDHEFTEYYSKELFLKNVMEAHSQGVDYLLGGITSYHLTVPITQNRWWIDSGNGAQFIVIYRRFFKKILDEEYDDNVQTDISLSKITDNKMVFNPFISIKKNFGYSDIHPIHITPNNFQQNDFSRAACHIESIKNAHTKYKLA
jgi:hypothetical protein